MMTDKQEAVPFGIYIHWPVSNDREAGGLSACALRRLRNKKVFETVGYGS